MLLDKPNHTFLPVWLYILEGPIMCIYCCQKHCFSLYKIMSFYIDVNCAFRVVTIFPAWLKIKYNIDNFEAQQDLCEAAIMLTSDENFVKISETQKNQDLRRYQHNMFFFFSSKCPLLYYILHTDKWNLFNNQVICAWLKIE